MVYTHFNFCRFVWPSVKYNLVFYLPDGVRQSGGRKSDKARGTNRRLLAGQMELTTALANYVNGSSTKIFPQKEVKNVSFPSITATFLTYYN